MDLPIPNNFRTFSECFPNILQETKPRGEAGEGAPPVPNIFPKCSEHSGWHHLPGEGWGSFTGLLLVEAVFAQAHLTCEAHRQELLSVLDIVSVVRELLEPKWLRNDVESGPTRGSLGSPTRFCSYAIMIP